MGRKKISIYEKCENFYVKELHKCIATDKVYEIINEILNRYMRCQANHNSEHQQNYFFKGLKNGFQQFFVILEEGSEHIDKKAVLSALIATLFKYDEELAKEIKEEQTAIDKARHQAALDFIAGRKYRMFDPSPEIIAIAKQICAESFSTMPRLPSERKEGRNNEKK